MGTRERNECMNEIRLLQSMQHPHIIRYLDCQMERNELTVVMELADHGDLAGLVRQAVSSGVPLGEPRVWHYFAQIADALAYMHEPGPHIVHSHTVHLALGALRIPRTMCGTGTSGA